MARPPPPIPHWPTLLLLGYLPLVKILATLANAGEAWSLALFYGGGLLLSAGVLAWEGGWESLNPLLKSPLRGIWVGACLFGGLMALAALLLFWPAPQPYIPLWLHHLISLFDPFTVSMAYESGEWNAAPWDFLRAGLGGLAEEWVFRGVLLWRWLGSEDGEYPYPSTLGPWGRVVALNAYFALLHWPATQPELAVAFLGGCVLSLLLIWRRNLWIIGTLHLAFNWKMLVG